MHSRSSRYIPALGLRLITPIYDPIVRWGMREAALKGTLVMQTGLRDGMDALDVGCGTGTLALMLKEQALGARVTGLDANPQVLAMAASKARRAGLAITWVRAMAYELPFADGSFDVVVSSLIFHHLVRADKRRMFRKILRVLRPDGAFHLLDFGPGRGTLGRLQAVVMKPLEEAADNFSGRIPRLLRDCGFGLVKQTAYWGTLFGPVVLYRAER